MNQKNGSTTVFITGLCFVVLALGALIGWQWHRRQMETVLLENLSLTQKVEDLETEVIKLDTYLDSELDASLSAEPASSSSSLDLSEESSRSASPSAVFE